METPTVKRERSFLLCAIGIRPPQIRARGMDSRYFFIFTEIRKRIKKTNLNCHTVEITMKSVIYNPFRIIGILANSSEKEILKQKNKIKRFSEVGKEISSEYDFPFLDSLERSSTIIDKAFSDIEQNQNKVTHSLFWFINMSLIDNTAIQHLISGNKEKAIEIWEKLTAGKEVNAKNFSAFNNIGTLYLLENSREKIKQGITVKIKLIESEYFKDFVHTVADETFSIDTNKQIEIWIDELLTQLTNKFSIAETIDLFSNCSKTTQKYLSKKFTEEPVHKIETQLEQCNKKRTNNKGNAYKFGTDLYTNTKSELALLKSIVGNANLQYKMLADNIAKEILQCSIDYFNESQEQEKSGNYLEEAMKLAKIAESVAINDATKNKIKENIGTLEGMKDRELNQAIDILKFIKQAFQTNEAKITKEVLEMPMGYNQFINWSKVNQMIANSLDWNKVVELIRETIPLRSVEKIKNSNKEIKITEYKSLVDFILEKLNYSQKNQVKYLCYWKTVNATLPLPKIFSTPTPSTEKSWAEENPGCLFILIIAGIILLISIFSFSSDSSSNDEKRINSNTESNYNYPETTNSLYEYDNNESVEEVGQKKNSYNSYYNDNTDESDTYNSDESEDKSYNYNDDENEETDESDNNY